MNATMPPWTATDQRTIEAFVRALVEEEARDQSARMDTRQ
jgi:hypothetical protein